MKKLTKLYLERNQLNLRSNMKYFLDTEFIEGFHKPLFGKKRHFIDLISIGIVAEDGRKLYLISSEYDYDKASDWVKENVIRPLYQGMVSGDERNVLRESDFHKIYGVPNSVIAKDILEFVNPNIDDLIDKYTRHDCWAECYYKEEFAYIEKHNTEIPETYYKSGSGGLVKNKALIYNKPEFYAYYADYDWVVFCSLFGTMMDLPKGFPMYCNDLKQTYDEKQIIYDERNKPNNMKDGGRIARLKEFSDYPKQENEHDALADAKWSYKLYKFLQTI